MAMGCLENEFRRQGKANLADIISAAVRKLNGSDISFPSVAAPTETMQTPEQPQEYRPFTNEEKEALIKDGAAIYVLTGETIEAQRRAGRLFWYIADGRDRLLKVPSVRTEVAIYPDPEKFFVPNSGGKNLAKQERLTKKDAKELRKRTGLGDDIDEIIPDQASTLTELTFKHLDRTTQEGEPVWLFGKEYVQGQGLRWVYGRTKNPVNKSGSHVAGVGSAGPGFGVRVDYWRRNNGHDGVRVVRLVVAKKK